MSGWRCPALLCILFLAACAEVEKREPVPEPPKIKAEAKIESQPLKYLIGRKFTPQPTRPINVTSRCSHRDAVGTRTRLDLVVKNAEVKVFSAEVNIPKHGLCRFHFKQFEQRDKLPQVLLTAKDGSPCLVRMWEEAQKRGSRITIAFNGCSAACQGDTFDYLWPIIVDTKTGRCF